MATMNENFFAELLSPKAAKWSAGVAFDRSNGLPLDQWSVFQTKAAAEEYLSNSKAYPGQVIAYAEADGSMTACVLSQNADGTALTLKQIGVIPLGDDKSIDVDENGNISIHGFDALTNEHVGYLPRIKKVVDKEANPGYVSDSKSETADTILALHVSIPGDAIIDKVTLAATSVSTGNPALFDPSTYKYTFSNGTVNFMLTGFNAGEYNNFNATVDYTYVDPKQATPEESHLEVEWAPVSAIVEGDTNTITQVVGTIGDKSFVTHTHNETTDTHTYTINLSPVTDRLDALEGGADEEGSVEYIVASAVGELENNLQDGAVVVAKASEAENAAMLGGKLPAYYATKAEFDGYIEINNEAISGIEEELALKATIEQVNNGLNEKLDKETYNTDKATFATKTELGSAVEEINGEIATKADDDELQALKTRVETFLDNTGAATEAIDTLQELLNYIATHDDADITGILASIQGLTDKLAGIDGTVKAYVDGAIEALAIGDYAKAADLTTLAGRVAALEGKVDVEKVSTAIENAATGALNDAKAYAKEYADGLDKAMDTRVKVLEGIDHDAYKAADTALQGVLEGKIATAKGEAISDADGKLNAYKGEVATTLTNYYNKTEIDGKVGTINAAIEGEAAARGTLATEVANDKKALADYKTEMVTELGKKVDAGTIAHTSENVEEGVTRNGTTLNIVVDAYKKAETYTKGEVDNAITKKIQDVTGGENASAVKLALNDYIKANDTEIYGATKVAEWTVDGVYTPDYTKDSRLDSLKGQADGNARDILALQNTVNGTADNNGEDGLVHRLAKLETEVRTDVDQRLDSAEGAIAGLTGTTGTHTTEIATLKETTIPGLQAAINGKVAQGDFDALNAKVDTGDKNVSKYVEDAIKAAAYDDTAVKKLISDEADRAGKAEAANKAAIEAIYKAGEGEAAATGLLAEEIARAKAAEKANADDIVEINALLNTISDTDSITSLKELAIWIEEHETEVLPVIEQQGKDIDALELKVNTGDKDVATYIADAIAGIPMATAAALGLVKSAADVDGKVATNKVYVGTDGVGEVKAIGVDKLVNVEGFELILNGGNAALN